MAKKKTEENTPKTVRVRRPYKDKDTGVIHNTGEVLELTAARAKELMSYRNPFVELTNAKAPKKAEPVAETTPDEEG